MAVVPEQRTSSGALMALTMLISAAQTFDWIHQIYQRKWIEGRDIKEFTGTFPMRPDNLPSYRSQALSAVPYFWATDRTREVDEAAESYPIRETVLHPSLLFGDAAASFHWFERPWMKIRLGDGLEDRALDVLALLSTRVQWTGQGGLGWQVTAFTESEVQLEDREVCAQAGLPQPPQHVLWPRMVFFESEGLQFWSECDVPNTDSSFNDERDRLGRFLLTAAAWLQQEILVAPTRPVPRQMRKSLGKAQPGLSPLVNIVQLRKHRHAPSAGESTEQDWQFQWYVRGHWREQWYPSDRTHRPIWIHPHIKGPEDKPLKPPAAIVFNVSR